MFTDRLVGNVSTLIEVSVTRHPVNAGDSPPWIFPSPTPPHRLLSSRQLSQLLTAKAGCSCMATSPSPKLVWSRSSSCMNEAPGNSESNNYHRQGRYVLRAVCLFVCLLLFVTSRENYRSNLHEHFTRDASLDKEVTIKFRKSPGSKSGSRNFSGILTIVGRATLRDTEYNCTFPGV